VGMAIRKRRMAAGLSQAELAHKIGSADATLSRIERGRRAPSQRMLESIAAGLGCSVKDFFDEDPAPSTVGKIRPVQARLLAFTKDMTDAEVDDIMRALKTLVMVGRRTAGRG